MIGSGLWCRLLGESDLVLKEVFAGAHEGVRESPKVGAIAEFIGENISAVDVSGNIFDLNLEVLFLALADKVFSEVEVIEDFGCCCFGPVTACVVVVVYGGG